MKGVVEYVSDGVLQLDEEWRVADANGRAELMLGKREAELVGHVWWELFPHLKGTPTEKEMRAAAAGSSVRRFRVFHPTRYAWHDVTALPENGGLTLVMRDTTDIVRARQSEAVQDAVRQIIDHAPIAISLTRGPDHRLEVVNAMARQMLGGKSIEGQNVRSALPELEGQGLFEILDQVYTSGESFEAQGLPVTFDRQGDGTMTEGFFDVVYQPILEVDGRVTGVLSISVEVPAPGGGPAATPSSRLTGRQEES